MAKYMIAWELPKENRNEAIDRFMEGSRLQPPDGVTHIDRWHSAAGGLGWGIAEADDPKHIADWIHNWSDLIDYEVYPILNDEEMGEVFAKHRG